MSRLVVMLTAVFALACGGGVGATTAASMPRAACGGSLETWFAPEGNGYAGGAQYVVEFSNVGRTTCTVRGYPTAKLTENGMQVGLKSTRDPLVPVKTVTLAPGRTAHVALFITDAGAVCHPVATNGLSIRPPGVMHASHFPLVAFGGCPGRSTLRVDAVHAGVGIPYYSSR